MQNENTMKLIQKHSRLTQVKEGRKVLFEILETRSGKFNSLQNNLGLVSDCDSIEECIDLTIEKVAFLKTAFSNMLIKL